MHHDAGHHVGLVVGGGIAAHEIGQQVAQQRAVRQHGQVKMSEKIHPSTIPEVRQILLISCR
ncbi:hypothetical protein IC615_09915 [Serratia ureilytica]